MQKQQATRVLLLVALVMLAVVINTAAAAPQVDQQNVAAAGIQSDFSLKGVFHREEEACDTTCEQNTVCAAIGSLPAQLCPEDGCCPLPPLPDLPVSPPV